MLQKANVRLVAFLLLLAFFQKMGLELWLHDWLHEPRRVHQIVSAKASLQQGSIQCHCLDEVTMPQVQSDIYVCKDPQRASISLLPSDYSSILYTWQDLPAQRGPPSACFL